MVQKYAQYLSVTSSVPRYKQFSESGGGVVEGGGGGGGWEREGYLSISSESERVYFFVLNESVT